MPWLPDGAQRPPPLQRTTINNTSPGASSTASHMQPGTGWQQHNPASKALVTSGHAAVMESPDRMSAARPARSTYNTRPGPGPTTADGGALVAKDTDKAAAAPTAAVGSAGAVAAAAAVGFRTGIKMEADGPAEDAVVPGDHDILQQQHQEEQQHPAQQQQQQHAANGLSGSQRNRHNRELRRADQTGSYGRSQQQQPPVGPDYGPPPYPPGGYGPRRQQHPPLGPDYRPPPYPPGGYGHGPARPRGPPSHYVVVYYTFDGQ